MKVGNLRLLPMAVFALGLVIGYAPPGYALHETIGDITLKSAAGTTISIGSATPYSPKQTCGTTDCHNYESDVAYATKNHGTGQPTYQVPYPQHGVTAGYHFQQGRNLDWGDAQREFFHQADFTSSGGMWGKY